MSGVVWLKGFLSTKRSPFLTAYYFFIAGMSANFFLTPNPYAAGHSGGAARWAGVYSESWSINVAIIMATALLGSLALRVRVVHRGSFYLCWLLISYFLINSLITSGIFINPTTYIYTCLAFCAVVVLAKNESSRFYSFNINLFLLLIFSLYLMSLFLALVRPGIWGWPPLQFGRDVRGELTFSLKTGLPLILVPAFLVFYKGKSKVPALIVVLLFLVELSFYTRLTIYKFVAPLFIYAGSVILKRAPVSKTVATNFIFLSLLASSVVFAFFLDMAGVNFQMIEGYLTGRMELWLFHLEVFLDNFWFGFGPDVIAQLGYSGQAVSEIGVLAAFSHYGVFFGFFQVLVVFISAKKSFFVLTIKDGQELHAIFFSLVVLTYFPIWLLFGGWRVLNAESFIFWYAVFFMFFLEGWRLTNDRAV